MIQTYVVFSRGLYKIGKSKNVETRLKSLKTANPDIELLYLINEDVEKELHLRFKDSKYKNEWFRLTENDLLIIEQDYYQFFNNQKRSEFSEIETEQEYLVMKSVERILLWYDDKLCSELCNEISNKIVNFENRKKNGRL